MRTSSENQKNTPLFYVARLLTTLVLLVLFSALLAVLLYETVPMRNTQRTHFDAIIVLGCPTNPDGTASPDERERVSEGVREFRAGVAPRLIMTGGAAHNRYIEAHAMTQFAEAQGVPASAIFEEQRAQDTIQNAYYSVRMMQVHGWHAAEVLSEPSHLPRASLIFQHFPIEWRMQASHWPAKDSLSLVFHKYAQEIWRVDQLRLFGFAPSKYLESHASTAQWVNGTIFRS